MVPEAPLERDETGLARAAEGWFVPNAREARWTRDEGSACSEFEGDTEFEQFGIFLRVLWPGGSMGMYHWEADQEDFLVPSGEALIVEGEEQPLRRWDFFHCPPGTNHIIVGAGYGPCVVLAVGSREHPRGADWGAYTVDETALGHGTGVEEETTDRAQAYARVPKAEWTPHQEGGCPG